MEKPEIQVSDPTPSPERGRAKIFYDGTRVYAPMGHNQDGSWSRRNHIVAVFLDPAHAVAFVATLKAAGVPAYVDERGGD